MIKVNNSPKHRIFHLKKHENKIEFQELKNKIIEKIENKDYSSLSTLSTETYANEFSVFIFYNAIQGKLSSIANQTIKQQLEQLNWFKVLVGDINEIRDILKDNYYVLANLKPQIKDFNQYKEIFEKLYKNQLSNMDEIKKEFFCVFEDVNVCPYCNRNYINPIYKEKSLGGDNKKQSPDIEHFFPKSIYPFLSLSISNLLPSCAFCNKIKSDVDTYKYNCISPYEVKDDEFTFDFEIESSSVKTVILKSKSQCKNQEILHLESLYNSVHRIYINEMFEDILKYPDTYKKSLEKFDISKSDYKQTFRNYFYEKDFNKQPLSKMTKDLYKILLIYK